MRQHRRMRVTQLPVWPGIVVSGLLVAIVLNGCGAVHFSSAVPSAAFFNPTAEDAKRLSTLTRELDTMAGQCTEPLACDQVHYARALVALFESREAARTSFRRVTNSPPESPLATSSARWLQLLDDDGLRLISNPEQQHAFHDVTSHLVREWIDRKLNELRDGDKSSSLGNKNGSAAGDPSIVQSLQRQVKERDRRIAELTSQLDALKRIDQDMDTSRKHRRPPATLIPEGMDRHP